MPFSYALHNVSGIAVDTLHATRVHTHQIYIHATCKRHVEKGLTLIHRYFDPLQTANAVGKDKILSCNPEFVMYGMQQTETELYNCCNCKRLYIKI